MKNFFLAAFISISFIYSCNSANFCPNQPVNIGSPFWRSVQKITGINFIATQLAEFIIEKEIKKYIKTDKLNLNLNSYGVAELKKGKIKGFNVSAKKINVDGISLSDFYAKSHCEYIYFDFTKNSFQTPVFADLEVLMTEEDLQTTFNNEKYKKLLSNISLKIDNKDLGYVDFVEISPKIFNGKICLSGFLNYQQLFVKVKLPVKLTLEPEYIGGILYLSNLQVSSEVIGKDLKFLTDAIKVDMIELIDFSKFYKDNLFINIDKIESISGKISIKATALISENYAQIINTDK